MVIPNVKSFISAMVLFGTLPDDILYRLSDKFEDYIRKLFPEPKNDEY